MLDNQRLIDKIQELIDAKRAFMEANSGMGIVPWCEFTGMISGWELVQALIRDGNPPSLTYHPEGICKDGRICGGHAIA